MTESPCDGCGRLAYHADRNEPALCDSCADELCVECGGPCEAVCRARPARSAEHVRIAACAMATILAAHTELDTACVIARDLSKTLASGGEDPISAALEAVRSLPAFGGRDPMLHRWAELATALAECWSTHVVLLAVELPKPPRLPTPVPAVWRFGCLPDHRVDDASATVRPGVAA